MEQKTFTEKLVALLINGNMPSAKGEAAKESGLIIALSDGSTPVCASYGSALDMTMAVASILEQSEPIRAVLTASVVAYATSHPNDQLIAGIKDF